MSQRAITIFISFMGTIKALRSSLCLLTPKFSEPAVLFDKFGFERDLPLGRRHGFDRTQLDDLDGMLFVKFPCLKAGDKPLSRTSAVAIAVMVLCLGVGSFMRIGNCARSGPIYPHDWPGNCKKPLPRED